MKNKIGKQTLKDLKRFLIIIASAVIIGVLAQGLKELLLGVLLMFLGALYGRLMIKDNYERKKNYGETIPEEKQ